MLADRLDPDWRVAIWLTGAAVVFFGLCVLSIGTRAHLDLPGGTDDDAR